MKAVKTMIVLKSLNAYSTDVLSRVFLWCRKWFKTIYTRWWRQWKQWLSWRAWMHILQMFCLESSYDAENDLRQFIQGDEGSENNDCPEEPECIFYRCFVSSLLTMQKMIQDNLYKVMKAVKTMIVLKSLIGYSTDVLSRVFLRCRKWFKTIYTSR